MSDLVVWARIVEQGPSRFLVIVSTAAALKGDESSATDLRTTETASRREAFNMRDTMIAKVVEAVQRRGHDVVRVRRVASWDKPRSRT